MQASMHEKVVVSESSARQVGGRFLPLNVGHFDICRPKSEVDSGYLFLINHISKVIEYKKIKECHQLDLPNGLVGMEDKKEFICEKLGVVSILGLVGMGGIGKTTISKFVYNSQAKFYDKTCFFQDVRSKDLASLQKELLLELCGVDLGSTSHVSWNHIQSIKQCIKRKRVLIVIDDVGDFETLKGLQVPSFQKSLSGGSRVIVTCRNRQVLDTHIGLERLKDVEIMDVEFLNDIQALELFRYHVYQGIEDDETEAFESLAMAIAKACGGLPLSLEVIGQHLRKQHVHPIGMRKGMWEEALRKLHEAETFDGGDENEVLWKRLKISYDDLSNDSKSMFLDFACFFCENSYEYLNEQSIGWVWNSPTGLQNLLARSLIKVGRVYPFGHSFSIHDQLRDMGRRIANDFSFERSQVSLKNVTRLWEAKKSLSFLEENEGFEIIEGISLRYCSRLPTIHSQEDSWLMEGKRIQRFDRLRLLDLECCGIEVVEFFLRKCLKELSWLWLNGTMVMSHAIEGIGFCTRLRVLQMRGCDKLKELPTSFGNLVHLLELNLSWCLNLQSLPSEIGHLQRLKSLNLGGCLSLEEVPPSVSQLTNLQYLGLYRCSQLVRMVEFETQMDHLYELNLSDCKGLHIPFKSLGKLHQLRELSMARCSNLVIENPFESFGHLSRLEKLNLLDCESLIFGICLDSIDGKHAFEEAKRSWNVLIESYSRLQDLQLPIISQTSFRTYPKLKDLVVQNGFHLEELPAYLGDFTQLETLQIYDNDFGFLKKLSDKLCNLKKLKKLFLWQMGALESLPNNLGDLSLLKNLEFYYMTKIEELPPSLGNLFQLEELFLISCTNLKYLPESFTSLTRLSRLRLEDCVKLVELPTTLGHLSQLKYLNLRGCKSLERLPKSSSSLIQLSNLYLHECDAFNAIDADQVILLQKLEQCGCKIWLG